MVLSTTIFFSSLSRGFNTNIQTYLGISLIVINIFIYGLIFKNLKNYKKGRLLPGAVNLLTLYNNSSLKYSKFLVASSWTLIVPKLNIKKFSIKIFSIFFYSIFLSIFIAITLALIFIQKIKLG